MLEPREADLPVLLLVLVVLPLVTYILLGIWSESGKNKARINMLAQLAAEEALKVEYVAPVNVAPVNVTPTVPSSKIAYQCAKCFAPATTRCSKCKSVRYCSGKCQIMHWRLGHKQECQQLAMSRSISLSADSIQFRPFLDNSTQVLGNVISEPQHGDFLSDVSSDTSLTTSDLSYDTAAERMLSDSDKQIRSRSRKETRSNGVAACSFDDNVITGADAPLGDELGNGSFTTCFEVKRSHDSSSTLKNLTHQTNKIKGETRNINKPSCAVENSENRVNEHEAGTVFSSENELSSSNKALELNLSAEDASIKGSILYKRPPYILGSATPLSQKSAEQIPTECRSQGMERNAHVDDESISAAHMSTSVSDMGGPQLSGSKKSSKVHKKNPAGLIPDCSKNKMLFPYEDLVKYFQCEHWGISPRGLLNCGNSCYANAVLQCLTCTKPLMVHLLRRSHSRTCRVRDWCLLCELEQHVSMLREGGGPLSPSRLLSNMRSIGCRMGGGNQEDAHEFLRLLVMSMQSICLEGFGGEKEVNPRLQETTLIQQIFGGRLKSKVKCLRCHLESERYENIMDLTLEIHGWVESLEDALTQFTAPEDLDGENMYRCGRCATYVKARKQLSVHEVPNILTIVLKRFQSGKYGKINKCVTFPDMLDMIPFVTGNADSPPLYMLYGVVVHLDTLNASFSGHYVSYVKDMQGTWFRIDDSEMHSVSLSEVMSEGAYMLFYSRSFPRPPRLYMEKEKSSVHAVPKTEKAWRTYDGSGNSAKNIHPREQKYSDSVIMDFSDSTSSDWSLFTGSDESSFTTESTRDSVSTVDHGDANGLDPISSIFAPPFYVQECSQSNTISCTKISTCRPQTRFFSEGRGLVLDSSLMTHPRGNVHLGCRSRCNL